MKRGSLTSATQRQMDRLADEMAEGCPSVIEAARRMEMPQSSAARLWNIVRRELGAQAQ